MVELFQLQRVHATILKPEHTWGIEGGCAMGEGGQKVQTVSCKISKSWDVLCSMVTIVNNMVLCIWKLLRE